MLVPSLLLKQLYTFGSLKNTDRGVEFALKNRLSDAQITSIKSLKFGNIVVPIDHLKIDLGADELFSPQDISKIHPLAFPLRKTLDLVASIDHLPEGKHRIEVAFSAKPFGNLKLKVDGAISNQKSDVVRIPRDNHDDYSEAIIKTRQKFLADFTKAKVDHITNYSFDPHILDGNCEHFTGVAQIPMGIAGPIKINGEFAKEEYLIPMATTEGTLVASYNRGIKVLNQSGGVKCSVIEDVMQRAPVFVFDDARGARDFVGWVKKNQHLIAAEAEATTSIGKLKYIDPFLASKFAYLRFNYSTGDAAGQNMVGRATFAACSWILDAYKEHEIKHFYLESNLATDKKASQVNIMRTRGKRVTAEITIKRDVLIQTMRVDPETLAYHAGIANVGAILSGANNNGLHSANGITAIFIATGQDVANVAESSAGIVYCELTPEKDLYFSITIPSLIVATYGGGTSLATQKECLELMGCYGKNGVYKFAEIVAGVVLAGEISLASAISSSDWVSSHEKYGRNR
ncbi:MAG: hydroxymethylglutaryl-CoA reductase [Chitinophagales bacterium]